MLPTQNQLVQALRHRLCAVRGERGFMILQVLVIIWLISAITLSAATLILMEQSSYMHARDKQAQLDKSDAALGWLAANVEPAALPLKATSADSITWVYNGNCIKVYVDTTAKKLLEKQKSYSGSGDCSSELSDPSLVPATLATGVDETALPAAHPAVLTFYTGVDNTSPTLPATSATNAKSFDITLPLDGVMDPASTSASTYHIIFGGVVASSKLADNAVTSSKLATGAVSNTKIAANGVPPAAFDANAISTRDFVPLVAGDNQNYAPQGSTGTNTWRANTTSLAASGLSASSAAYTLIQVNYADRCVPGKQLWARGVYTIYNPSTSSSITVGVRLREYDGPNPPANLSAVTGASVYQVAPSAIPSGSSGFYAERASGWRMIDGGGCSANNELVNSGLNPRFYQLETNTTSTGAFAVVNAGIELRYAPAAAAPSAQPPYTPEHVSPADGSFVLTATPTLKARFNDPNAADTGQLNFQVCSDPACGTVIISGSSASGIANGSSGTWVVPGGSLLDGGTYYWRVQGQDNTGLTSPFTADTPTQFKVSTTPPTLSLALVAGTNPSYQSITGTTVYFNPAQSGSFTVQATVSDAKWPLDSLTFPALGANWTGSGTVNGPSNGPPTVNQTYSWASGAGTKSPARVTVSSTSSRTATANFDAIADPTAPTGGTISYVNGMISSGPVALSGTFASDSGSGMASGVVQKRTVALSGGACGTSWSAWADAITIGTGTGPWSVNDNTVAQGTCYQYRYVANDKVGNAGTFTTTATVQLGQPPINTVAPVITDTNGAPLVDGDTVTTDNGTWSGSPTSYTYAWDVCGYKSVIQQDNPVGYWRLGEPSGWSVAVDESGNGNGGWYDGVSLGASGALSGDSNTGISLSGGTQGAVVPDATAFHTANFTVEAWVKTTSTSREFVIWKNETTRPSRSWAMEINAVANKATFRLESTAGPLYDATSTTNVNDGSWHHLVGTYDGTNVRLYVDGALQATTPTSGWVVLYDSTPIQIGRFDASTSGYTFNGSLDDIAVYGSALSGTRITAHYQAGNAGTGLCSAISGQTGSSLTVAAAHVGNKVRSEVTATNTAGPTTAASAQSSVVQAIAPANTSVPTISDVQGNVPPIVGDTVNASPGVWTGSSPSYSYQWQRCDASGGAVVADTPAGFWRLNEPNGTSAFASDMSGNARAGAYIGSPTYGAAGPVAGSPNGAVQLNGSTQAVGMPAVPLSGDFTLEAWVNLAGDSLKGATGYGTIMGQDAAGSPFRRLLVSTSGQLLAQIDGSGNFFSTSNITLNAWHLVDFVFTGSNAYWYIDGAAAGSEATSGLTWNKPFRVGAYDMSNYMFNGRIADVAVYDTALAAGRLSAHFSAASSYCSPIAGATGSSYTVQAADAGATLKVSVTGANPAGNTAVASVETGRIATAAPLVAAPPTVSGTLQVGQPLTSSAGSFSGSPTITKAYAWQRCGYGASVRADNPTAWWRLGDTSGTVATDQLSFANGSYVGGPTLGAGGAVALDGDSSVFFNGSSQYVDIASPPQFDSGDFTIAAWVLSQSTAVQQIWNSGYTLGNQDVELELNTNGQPDLYARDGSGAVAQVMPAMNLADGQWHQIVGERSGSNWYLFVDGTQVGSASTSIGDVDAAGAAARIGNGLNGVANRWWNGKIDEVAVYKNAVPAADILAQYNMARQGCQTISGQTTSSYTPTSSDVDSAIRSVVTATNGSGSASAGSQPTAKIVPPPTNISAPTASGIMRDGQLLQKTSDGTWNGTPTISYRWQHCKDYAGQILADSPLSYWRLNETSGTTAIDSASGRNGSYVSPILGQTGAINGCDSSNTAAGFSNANYITVNPAVNTASGNSTTVEFWMYWNGGDVMMPFSWNTGGVGNGDLYFSGGYFGFNTYNGDVYGISSAGLANSWHLVDAVFPNGAPSGAKLYIDGVQKTLTQEVGTTNIIGVGTGQADIGDDGIDHASYRFTGKLDEVAVYSGALSSAQIAAHYSAGTATYSTIGSNANNYTLTSSDIGYRMRLAVDATTSGGTTTAYTSVFNGETYRAAVLDDEPIRYWRLGEASGASTAVDAAGNENLTYYNSPTLGTGVPWPLVGSSDTDATFNGSTQYASSGTAAVRSYALTLEGWVKTSVVPSSTNGTIVGSLGNRGQEQLGIQTGTGNPFFIFRDGATYYTLVGPTSIVNGAWHYVVGTWDGTTEKLYVDGALVASQNMSGATIGLLDCPWQIGGINCAATGYSAQYLAGSIDDVAIYDHALTSSDVWTHWNAANNGVALADIPTAGSNPTLSGKAQVGQTLTSSAPAFSGSPSITSSYQWQRCGYKASVMEDNPLEYLRLGEPAPQWARDETTHSATGTYVNFVNTYFGQPAGIQTGDGDTSVWFNGTNNYITVNPAASTTSGHATTVEFWMDWNGGDSQMPFSWGNPGGSALGDLYFSSGYFGFNTWNSDVYGISSAGLANSWHLVDAVFPNGAPGSAQIYIDGVQQTLSQKLGTTTAIGVGPGSGVIGSSYAGAGSYPFDGYLDEFAVYDGTLSARAIARHYAAGMVSGGVCRNIAGATSTTITPPQPASDSDMADNGNTLRIRAFGTNSGGQTVRTSPISTIVQTTDANQTNMLNPVLFWRMDDTGTTLADFSGRGNTGTISGTYTLSQPGAFTAIGDNDTSIAYTSANATGTVPQINTASGAPTTVNFWMYWNGSYDPPTNNGPIIFSFSSGAELWLSGAGQLGFNSGNGDNLGVSASGLANGWHMITAKFVSQAMASSQLWIDGVQQTLVQTGSTTNPATSTTVNFGYGGSTYQFQGKLDDLAIYNYGLTSSQVQTLYNADVVGGPLNNTAPSISGTAQESYVLTANPGWWVGQLPMTTTYQWRRCDTAGANCVSIGSATGSTYTLTAADIGSTIRVNVTKTNTSGTLTVASAQTATIIALPPVNTVIPAVSDVQTNNPPTTADTLSTTNGTWTTSVAASYTYQWQRGPSYNGTVQTDSPATYWHLDETSGTTASNAGTDGAAKNGTYSGATLGVTGALPAESGTAMSSGNVSTSLYANTGNFTLELWANLTAQPGGYTNLFSNGDGAGGTGGVGFYVYGSSSNPCTSTCADGHAACPTPSASQYTAALFVSGDDLCVLSENVPLNGWHLLAVTHSGGASNGTWTMYLDGVQQGAVTSNGNQPTGTMQHTMSSGGLAAYVPGAGASIDEPAYYNAALTQTRLQAHYTNGSAPVYSDVAGATGSTYALSSSDLGQALRVKVTATNSGGSSTATAKASAAVVNPVAPANTVAPTVSGAAVVGSAVSAGNGTWTGTKPISYTYQWQRCTTYGSAVAADAPGGWWRMGEPNGSTTLINQVAGGTNATVSGSVALGQTSQTGDSDTAASFTGGTASAADYGSAGNGINPYTAMTMEFWFKGAPPTSGNFLFVKPYTSYAEPYYQYGVNGTSTIRAVFYTRGTFALNTWDTGVAWPNDGLWHYYAITYDSTTSATTLYIDGTQRAQSTTAISGEMGKFATNLAFMNIPTSPGSTIQGQLDEVAIYDTALSSTRVQAHFNATTGTSCSDIPGATSSTYTPTSADLSQALRVKVTATNTAASTTANSTNTVPVVPANPPANTATPTISGTANPGQNLTATTGVWTGPGTITYSYQWQRSTDGGSSYTDIAGATGTSYTLVNDDSGYLVRMKVTAQNAYGNTVAASSAASVGGRVVSINGTLYNLDSAAITLDYTGSIVTLTPRRSFSVTAKLWAGGGSGGSDNTRTDWGGGGGAATTTLNLTAGQTYSLVVGGGGTIGGGRAFGGGGSASGGGGGGGGGYSGIFNTGVVAQGNALVLAGGGGGGANDPETGGPGGGSGGYQGNGGCTCSGNNGRAGGGGDQGGTGGGIGGNQSGSSIGQNGSALQGGDRGAGNDAGGGGGYYGGGGGGSGNGGAGGGGSGFCASVGAVSGCSVYAASGQSAGNGGDSDRGSAGAGGNSGGNAQNGRIVFR